MGNFYMLPEEIVLEILSRVPAESILECKSVSKPWRSLIQHSSFSQMHLNRLNDLDSANDSDGKFSFIFYASIFDEEPFCYTEYDENLNRFTRTARINLRPVFKDSYILGSVNGLLCINAYIDGFYLQPACICNPITKEYIVLPCIVRKQLLTGFGYTPSTNECKVVRIPHCRSDPNYGIIQVYTLGSGIGWRNGRKMDYDVISFHQRGVFANEAIHWVEYLKGTIFSFDLVDEELLELPSPPWLSPVSVGLHVLGDFLCASDLCAGGYESYDIWVLKKNKSNHHVIWSKEFSSVNGKLIAFTKSGGLLCYDYRDKDVYLYPSKASSSRMLVNSGNNFNFGVPHKNTLVSLKTLGEEDTELMDSGERSLVICR